MREGGKIQSLLGILALRSGQAIPRDTLATMLWPASEPALAYQSLDSLVYAIHKLTGDVLDGASPVARVEGGYQLNATAGVGVDVVSFDRLAAAGRQHALEGRLDAAADAYRRALALYRGDLCTGTDLYAVVERERLRALYLTIRAQLADYYFDRADYTACLDQALAMLAHDPCREDAHRFVMRCYVRRGERTQALRQYRLCEQILHAEFETTPEAATIALFEQVRHNPHAV